MPTEVHRTQIWVSRDLYTRVINRSVNDGELSTSETIFRLVKLGLDGMDHTFYTLHPKRNVYKTPIWLNFPITLYDMVSTTALSQSCSFSEMVRSLLNWALMNTFTPRLPELPGPPPLLTLEPIEDESTEAQLTRIESSIRENHADWTEEEIRDHLNTLRKFLEGDT